MTIFLCDDTPQSFFTAVFDAYGKDCEITSDGEVQLAFGTETVRVHFDGEKCERVRRGLLKYDEEAVYDIITALRSRDRRKEQICLEYARRLMELKKPVKGAFNLPEVVEFNNILYKITGEVHRLKGLLRFKETADGTLYAPYSPDNDITDLLMPHFIKRLNSPLIIHDTGRKIAGIYNGKDWITGFAGEAEICISESEQFFEGLWKKYYNAVNIESRPHEKQMKRSMPVRYWKFLPEKNG